jgi:tetratricopeptide (TPR) repeat protein
LEYAYQLLETSPETSIFWVHASSQARFEESYKRIAAEFEIPGLDVLQPVRNWLELRYKKPWLMIVDNVDDTLVFAKTSSGRSLLEYIPRAGNGSVLYTSRSRDVCFNLVDDPVMVSPMSNVEAKALLANGNLNTGADDECDQLIEELDCLPLAITQANSYVANRGNTISQYLQLYQRDELLKNMLLGHEFSHARREGRIHGSAAATLLISFQHIKLESPKAIELLFLMSLLDRQDIPQEFLTSDDISVVDFEEAIGILKSYSLITEGSAENCFSMHQMVQEVARVTLTDEPENAFRQFAFRAVQVLASKFPDGEFATWKTCARYLPHAEAVLRRGVEGKPTEYLLEFTRLLSNVAFYTSKHKFPEAIEQAEESLRILQLAGQRSSPQLLQAKQKLAYIVYDQGDDDDRSVQLHREVFEAKEALLGPDHLDTLLAAEALSMALLASYDRGDDKESEELARRALAGKKRVMSDNDPKVLTSLLNVGLCLREQSKDSEAEAFLQQATVLNQQVHGEMHPETATALVNLGHLYRENERYEEALQYIHRATRIAERVYGAEHYETIIMQLHVSTVLNKSKKSEEAEPILRKWLPLIKRIWNHNHFWTLLCLRELHIALCKQSKLEEAESLVREEILERQQLIDSCSPKILPFMDQVAEIMYYAGKDDEAQAWRTKALAGWQRHYGDQDARTAHAMFELASGFFGLQQYDDSKAYFRKLISIRRSVLGSNHHSTLLAYFWLGKVLRKQKKFIESAACYRDVLAGWEIIHGYKHHFTLEAAEGLAFVLLDLKELKEAETLFQRVLTSRMETLGENDPLTFDSMEDLYSMYYKGDKFRESEELCRQMLKIQVRRSGENDHKTLRIKSNLLAALQKQKKPEADAILLDIESRCVKLGLLSFNEKKYADAAEYYERAFYLRAVKYGRGDLRTLTLRRKIGAVFTLQGDYEQAEEVYREVLDDIEQEDEPMDELKAEVCASLADLLDTLCRGDEAMRLRRSLRPAALGRKK